MNRWLSSTVKAYTDTFGLTDKPVVYEVGSRDGNDGVELAQRIYSGINLWRDATIVLFECNPPQQEVIERTYPKATLIKEAISNKKGTVDFLQIHGDKNMIGSSSMNLNRVKEPWVKETSIIKVPTRRLDDVIEELGHQEIDIMKIDIEHYTYEALESLGKHLRNVKVFHVETEIEGVARDKTNLDVALFMQERGYVCKALENEWGESIQDQVWLRS
jgi:FkbM family methyltransferase